MGVTGLLKQLKPVVQQKFFQDYEGKTAGIDGFAWLHRASYSCSYEVCQGIPTQKYIIWCLNKAKLLQNAGIKVIFVFDGAQLPMKRDEEEKRTKRRKKAHQEAVSALQRGDKSKAMKLFQQAVRVTRLMVRCLVERLKKEGIDFVVAPYEADSQLGYMYRQKKIDFAISEDSDLTLFGVKKVLYKINFDGSCGEELDIRRIKKFKGKPDEFCSVTRNFIRKHDLIHTCIVAGCDYDVGVKGFGVLTAGRHFRKFNNLEKAIKMIILKARSREKNINQLTEKFKEWRDTYRFRFERAVLTFLHQRVYDMDEKKVVYLTKPGKRYEDFMEKYKNHEDERLKITNDNFLGPELDPITARKIASCFVNPRDGKPWDARATDTLMNYFEPRVKKPRNYKPIFNKKDQSTAFKPIERKLNGDISDLLGRVFMSQKPIDTQSIEENIMKDGELQSARDPDCIAYTEAGYSDGAIDFNYEEFDYGDESNYLQSHFSSQNNKRKSEIQEQNLPIKKKRKSEPIKQENLPIKKKRKSEPIKQKNLPIKKKRKLNKEKKKLDKEKWSCSHCTFLNESHLFVCNMCMNKKNEFIDGPEIQSSNLMSSQPENNSTNPFESITKSENNSVNLFQNCQSESSRTTKYEKSEEPEGKRKSLLGSVFEDKTPIITQKPTPFKFQKRRFTPKKKEKKKVTPKQTTFRKRKTQNNSVKKLQIKKKPKKTTQPNLFSYFSKKS